MMDKNCCSTKVFTMIMDTFKKSKKNQLYYQISMNEITDMHFVINKFLLARDKLMLEMHL